MSTSSLYIVMADDSDPDIDLFRMALKKVNEEASIVSVKDGEELLKFLKNESPYEKSKKPDMILLDICMPNLDGIETLKELKNSPLLHSIPVVMLTNSNREEDVRLSYENGANSYIVKPYSGAEYGKIIEAIDKYWFSVVRLQNRPQVDYKE